jgi:peptidoglycan/LPS O-acetylase OafA/YrhL
MAATIYTVPSDMATAEWWLFRTPLRLAWAGHEAVIVFFALSGYVLTLVARQRCTARRWLPGYYGRRLVRLYFPVWGATVLAVALALTVPRRIDGMSRWMGMHENVTLAGVVKDLTLVVDTSKLNTPLWSLQWEVWFSLVLPLAWICLRAMRVSNHWLAWTLVFAGCSAMGQTQVVTPVVHVPGALLGPVLAMALMYLPVFAMGMVLALDRARVERAVRQLDRDGGRRWVWPLLACLGAIALVSSSYLPQGWHSPVTVAVTGFLEVCAAVALLIAALHWPALVRLLNKRSVQWVGTRSFSLYLVHEPIVVAAALVAHAHGWGWLAFSPLVASVALGVTALFYRFVEKPAVGWSHAMAHIMDRLAASTQENEVPHGRHRLVGSRTA